MSKHYSQSVKEDIVSLYNQGYGGRIIARQLNLDKSKVDKWISRYLHRGIAGLERLPCIRSTPEFRLEIVQKIIKENVSLRQTALEYNISQGAIEKWMHKFNTGGYALLAENKARGRKPKDMGRPRKKEPETELEKLRAENEFLRTKLALLKKVKALVEEKEARLRKIGQKPSKN